MRQRNVFQPIKGRANRLLVMAPVSMIISFMLFTGALFAVPELWMSWTGVLLVTALLITYLKMVLTKGKTSEQPPD